MVSSDFRTSSRTPGQLYRCNEKLKNPSLLVKPEAPAGKNRLTLRILSELPLSGVGAQLPASQGL